MLKIAYFGSPDISARVLEHIVSSAKSYKIDLVFTQPSKPAGRGLTIKNTPVYEAAHKLGIRVIDKPLSRDNKQEFVELLKGVDLCIVYAYKYIIPQEVLDAAAYGFINIHPSLLPAWRGPTPTVFPVLLNELKTGVSIIKMNSKMDEGEILSQEAVEIRPDDTAQSLLNTLTEIAKRQLSHILETKDFLSSKSQFGAPTYSILLNKEVGFVEASILQDIITFEYVELRKITIFDKIFTKNPNLSYSQNANTLLYKLWAALDPWPGLYTKIKYKEKELIVKIVEVALGPDGKSQLSKVQIEGKKPVDFGTFLLNYSFI